ncbi:hypothetical protein JCM10213_000774 [Rhodosporidiobolus nylandii]
MSNSSNPLDPSALLPLAQRLVSPSATLSSPIQALALLIHAIHSALSFRLVSPAPSPAEESEGADEQPHPNRLPGDWPRQGEELKFKYRHEQSSLEFVITVIELGGRALVAGVAVENPRSSSFDLLLTDYFSPTSFPCPTSSLSPSSPFSAPNRLSDLLLLYRLNVLQPLIPGLRKEGYTELEARDVPAAGGSGGGSGSGGGRAPIAGTGGYLPDRGGAMGMFPPARPHNPPSAPSPPPGRAPAPNAHRPPGAPSPDHDPLRIPGTGGRGGGAFGGSPLAEIGRRDLDPLGGMGGTFGGLHVLGGVGGFGGMGGGFGGGFGGGGGGRGNGGGMFMGPDHPLFRERFGNDGTVVGGGNGRRWGGDGYLPPGGAPPGARFDPVGPVNGPPGGSGLGIGPGQAGYHPGPGGPPNGGGQGQGGGPGGFGGRTHPDLERPGGSSDYDAMFG